MPRPAKKQRIQCEHYTWLLGKRGDVYIADGRANRPNLGRHSLASRDRADADRLLRKLDRHMAVRNGLIDADEREPSAGEVLPLAMGRQLYEDHVSRPRVTGGTRKSSQKRYRAVLDKFFEFLTERGVTEWSRVTPQVLQSYLKHLSDAGYAYATQYLEGTTIKQIVGFLVAEKRLLSGARIVLKLRKPRGTHTYCWSEAEVRAMLKYTAGIPELLWLHGILATLAYSGMRIGELIALRWTDLDFGNGKVSLVDESTAGRNKTGHVQTLKGGRGRSFPIHAELKPVLEAIPRGRDGFVFHGPAGGRLKADTVRNIFIREVLQPLAPMFPAPDGENGFADGRLHSFRHFFCSWCANAYTNLQMLQGWLGHQDSKMVNRYYHMNDGDARRQMGRLSLREEGAND